jgi:hypothetical protein
VDTGCHPRARAGAGQFCAAAARAHSDHGGTFGVNVLRTNLFGTRTRTGTGTFGTAASRDADPAAAVCRANSSAAASIRTDLRESSADRSSYTAGPKRSTRAAVRKCSPRPNDCGRVADSTDASNFCDSVAGDPDRRCAWRSPNRASTTPRTAVRPRLTS